MELSNVLRLALIANFHHHIDHKDITNGPGLSIEGSFTFSGPSRVRVGMFLDNFTRLLGVPINLSINGVRYDTRSVLKTDTYNPYEVANLINPGCFVETGNVFWESVTFFPECIHAEAVARALQQHLMTVGRIVAGRELMVAVDPKQVGTGLTWVGARWQVTREMVQLVPFVKEVGVASERPSGGGTVVPWDKHVTFEDTTAAPMQASDAALRTLHAMGYTWKGGDYWVPPLGKAPPKDEMPALLAARALLVKLGYTWEPNIDMLMFWRAPLPVPPDMSLAKELPPEFLFDGCSLGGKPERRKDGQPLRLDDKQVGGSHYSGMKITPWEFLESCLTAEEMRGYLKGEAIVYLAREAAKGGPADVSKARHVLQKLEELDAKMKDCPF